MQTITTVDANKDYFVSKVEFVGLKPVKPTKFSVRFYMSMINDLSVRLWLKNWDANGDDCDVDLEGEFPLELIPEFSINFRCFLKFENCNDDARDIVCHALMETLTKIPTMKVVIVKDRDRVFTKLIIGNTELVGEVGSDWIDYLFKEA